jgi:hypothetical protein
VGEEEDDEEEDQKMVDARSCLIDEKAIGPFGKKMRSCFVVSCITCSGANPMSTILARSQ